MADKIKFSFIFLLSYEILAMMRSPSAGLFYVFCDEKWNNFNGKIKIFTSHIAVPQGPWKQLSHEGQRLEKPENRTRFERIIMILERIDGVAIVTETELPCEMLPKGKRDSTSDLLDISRWDNLWIAAMNFGIIAVFPRLHNFGLQVQTADVYCDIRKLSQETIDTMEKLVTKKIPEMIHIYSINDHPHVRRFKFIPKPLPGKEPDQFQAGINIAHYLLKYLESAKEQSGERILLCNNTTKVKEYIENFI